MATCYYPWVTNRANMLAYDVGDEFPAPHESLRCHSAEQAADLANIASYEKGGTPFVVKLVANTGKHHIGGIYELQGRRAPNDGDTEELQRLYDAYNAKWGFAKAVVKLAKADVINEEDKRMIRDALKPKTSQADRDKAAAHRKTVAHRLDSVLEQHGGNLTAAYLSLKGSDSDVDAAVRAKIKRLMKSCPPCAGDTVTERLAALAKPAKEKAEKPAKAKAEKPAKAAKEAKEKAEKPAKAAEEPKAEPPAPKQLESDKPPASKLIRRVEGFKFPHDVPVDLSVFEGDYTSYNGEVIEQPFEDDRIPSPLSEGRYGVVTLCDLIKNGDKRSALALLSRIIVDAYARDDHGKYARSPADDGYDDYLEARELFDKAHDASVDDREIAELLQSQLREHHSLIIVIGLEKDDEGEVHEVKEFLGNIMQACRMPAPSLDFSAKPTKPAKAEKPAKPAKEAKVKPEKPAKPAKEPKAAPVATPAALEAVAADTAGAPPNAETLAFAKMLMEQMTAAAKDL